MSPRICSPKVISLAKIVIENDAAVSWLHALPWGRLNMSLCGCLNREDTQGRKASAEGIW